MRKPKWLRWEFMPFWLFYVPVYVYLLFRAIRFGRLGWFLAANPGLEYGGFVEYSKESMLSRFPARYVPAGRRFSEVPRPQEVRDAMKDLALDFPVILKPDIGERGYGVARIDDDQQLIDYLKNWGSGEARALLLQAYVPYRAEYGVMLLRLPGEKRPRISSLVIKEPLIVTGDGTSTLSELIYQGERTWLHRTMLRDTFESELDYVLPAGEEKLLADIGNHVRGSTFRNGNSLISEKLLDTFEPLFESIPGFHIGRFDVKAEDFYALESGKFSIMEVNGVNSEPAHIYDPDMKIFAAWADLLGHWQYISRISAANLEAGAQPEKASELISALRRHYSLRSGK